MSDLTKYTDPEARRLIFAAADIKARWLLINMAEREYDSGNLRACARLFHAAMYLEDRLAYQLYPPPTETSLPVADTWPPKI